MPLAVRKQTMARLQPACSDGESRSPCPAARAVRGMHVHIAGCHQRQAMRSAELLQARKASRIVGAAMQLDCNPAAFGKQLAQPCGLRARGSAGGTHSARQCSSSDCEIGARQLICALVGREARASDQRADLLHRRSASARAARRADRRACETPRRRSASGRSSLRRVVRSHDAGHRAFVRQRQRRIAEIARLRRPARPDATRRAGT